MKVKNRNKSGLNLIVSILCTVTTMLVIVSWFFKKDNVLFLLFLVNFYMAVSNFKIWHIEHIKIKEKCQR